MKHEKPITCMLGTALAFLLSLSAAGALMSGFDLTVDNMALTVLLCFVFSLISALCFTGKRTGWLPLIGLPIFVLILFINSDAADQASALINRISYVYDAIYHWGTIEIGNGGRFEEPSDFPLILLMYILSVAVAHTVCRRKLIIPATVLILLPLVACVVTTDTVPAAHWLFLLTVSLLVLILTHTVRRRDPAEGNRLTVRAILPILLVVGIVFVAVPHEDYDNPLERVQDEFLRLIGQHPERFQSNEDLFSTDEDGAFVSVDLKNLGVRLYYDHAVMDVNAQTGGTMYLRDQDYSAYSGIRWRVSRRDPEDFSAKTAGRHAGTTTITTRQELPYKFLPYYPASTETLVGGQIRNADRIKTYSFEQEILPDNWRDLVAAADPSLDGTAFGDDVYRNLPEYTLEWAEPLAQEILTNEASATEIADAIADYVKNSATYDDNTASMPSDKIDFARWFLEESDTGYCVHFATATTVLLRAAGLDARYVTGYTFDVKANETVTVIGDESHAWAEYYEPRLGIWIAVESTPPDLNTNTSPTWATTPTTAVTLPQETDPTSPSSNDDEDDKDDDNDTTPTTTAPAEDTDPFVIPPWLPWVIGGACAIILIPTAIVVQWQVRVQKRRDKRRQPDRNAAALFMWQETELVARLQHIEPPFALEQLAKKAKFSQYTLSDTELQAFYDHLAHTEQLLRKAPWYRRILYRLIYAIY